MARKPPSMCETGLVERSASEFLRSLRGKRSQVQLSRRLGYKGNPVTDWERGERFPTAAEALRAASLSRVDVGAAFARFSLVPLEKQRESFDLGAWLALARGTTSINELALRCAASRFSVSRWLKGEAKPRLPDFFRLVDAITGRLPELVAELVEIEQVPSLLPRYRAVQAAKGLAFEAPWTEAMLRLLETRAYRQQRRHHSSMLARALGIGEAEVQLCLERLLRADVIEKRGAGYSVKSQLAVDTQGGKQALNRLKQHWTQVAARRLDEPHPDDFFAYNVVSLSAADLEKVRDKLRAAFREIRSLVAASQPEQVAALINLQIISFGPPDSG
jgi:transcriptional regulator with XRE-family HTH domain